MELLEKLRQEDQSGFQMNYINCGLLLDILESIAQFLKYIKIPLILYII